MPDGYGTNKEELNQSVSRTPSARKDLLLYGNKSRLLWWVCEGASTGAAGPGRPHAGQIHGLEMKAESLQLWLPAWPVTGLVLQFYRGNTMGHCDHFPIPSQARLLIEDVGEPG